MEVLAGNICLFGSVLAFQIIDCDASGPHISEYNLGPAGALWNIGLEPGSLAPMTGAAAPESISQPVPTNWQATDNDAFLLPHAAVLESPKPAIGYHPKWDIPLHALSSSVTS
jgi:hypothetical protein